uniref:Transcription factor MYB114-like n=1 Tax=Nelumbo nucifera TaxID=4432 RepID=A0A822ZKD2_NELNU|nr:TPA_asm: hypothetical protein HUJ06_002281 [Nelumbo nucifera]
MKVNGFCYVAGLDRCRKSCRLRWLNYLRPNIKRGNFAVDEVDLIIRLHKLLGNRWSLIAARIPGRTANDVKNYWNSHLSKKLKSEQLLPSNLTTQLAGPQTSAANSSEWTTGVSDSTGGDHQRQVDEEESGEEETLTFWKRLLLEGEEMKTKSSAEDKEMAVNNEDFLVGFEELVQDGEIWSLLSE